MAASYQMRCPKWEEIEVEGSNDPILEHVDLLYYDGPLISASAVHGFKRQVMIEVTVENGLIMRRDEWTASIRLSEEDLKEMLKMLERNKGTIKNEL